MKKILSIILFAMLMLPAGAESLRVISFNIRMGVADDGVNAWTIRKEATPAMIYDMRPDVFGVQEAFRFQLDYILEQCPAYKCAGVGRDDGFDQGEHMSVFYNSEKLTLVKWGNYYLSETPELPSKGWDAACPRTATWCLFEQKSDGKRFYFVNTHLDHVGKLARKNGLKLIYDRIQAMNPDGAPMILTGDFNVTPDDPCLGDVNTLMKSARFAAKEADTAGSYNGWGSSNESIDYIYYSGFSCCESFKVINRQYAGKKYISDHYPVFAELKW